MAIWSVVGVNRWTQVCLEANCLYPQVVFEIDGMGIFFHESWKDCFYRNALICNISNGSINVTGKCSYSWLKEGSIQEQCGSNLTSVSKPYQRLQLSMVWTTSPWAGRVNTHQHTCTVCRDQEQPKSHFVPQQVAAGRDDAVSWGWFISDWARSLISRLI